MAEENRRSNVVQVTFGKRLRAGDKLEADDVFYDANSQTWKNNPCPGLVIQEGCDTVWIRPSKPA